MSGREERNILLVGVGGQGTILTSKILSQGLVDLGYDVKMSEIHGMAQRGGSVSTQIKYGRKIYAPNIGPGEADLLVAFEKAEALRWFPWLRKGGILVLDPREIYPVPVLTGAATYPENVVESLSAVVENLRVAPAAKVANELGSPRSQNMVLLGALVSLLGLEGTAWKDLVARFVPPKARDVNLLAFERGAALAMR